MLRRKACRFESGPGHIFKSIMEKTLYILCGLGFAGKTTLAKKISDKAGAIHISIDWIFAQKEQELGLNLRDRESWDKVFKIGLELAREQLEKGNSIIFDHVNERFDKREALRNLARTTSAKAELIYLNFPMDQLLARQDKNKQTKERHDGYIDIVRRQFEPVRTEENAIELKTENEVAEYLTG